MNNICQSFNISRQAHYEDKRRQQASRLQEEQVLEKVREIRAKHPVIGTRKLKFMLEQQPLGLKIGRDHLFELLRRTNLLVKRRKNHKRTTHAGKWRCENLLTGLTVERINQVWVSDITYLDIENSKPVYLFLVMDAYSRCILGYETSHSLAADALYVAMTMAIRNAKGSLKDTIFHSDHGSQYGAKICLDLISCEEMLSSMGAVGNCYENAQAERLNGILKQEYFLGDIFPNAEIAYEAVDEAIYLYNHERPHLSLQYAIPRNFYDLMASSDTVSHIPTPANITKFVGCGG